MAFGNWIWEHPGCLDRAQHSLSSFTRVWRRLDRWPDGYGWSLSGRAVIPVNPSAPLDPTRHLRKRSASHRQHTATINQRISSRTWPKTILHCLTIRNSAYLMRVPGHGSGTAARGLQIWHIGKASNWMRRQKCPEWLENDQPPGKGLLGPLKIYFRSGGSKYIHNVFNLSINSPNRKAGLSGFLVSHTSKRPSCMRCED